MKKSRVLALLLVLTLIISVALTACDRDGEPVDNSNNGQVEDTDNNNADNGDEQNQEQDITEKLAEEQVIRENLSQEPPSLDPQLSTDTTSGIILNDTLEGIIRMDATGEVKEGSGMALSWDMSEDGTVYTFHLRDASWSDGVPVTANNYEYAWKRLLDPKTASDYTFMAYDILNAQEYASGEITDPSEIGVKALDDKTLEVTLKSPNPVFIGKLQHSTFFPSRQDLIEEYGDKYASEAHLVPSCGPFMVDEWKHESKVILVKNPLYWDADTVKLERIELSMITNSNSIMGMYKTGQLDFTEIPTQFIQQYQDELITAPRASTGYRVFNTENKYVSSAKIRRGMRMALDMTKVYDTLASGAVEPAYAWVPPGMAGYDGKTFREISGEALFNDIGTGATQEEIKQMILEGCEEIGITIDELQNKISFLTGDSDSSLKYGEVYQQMWLDNAGVQTGIEQATWKVRLDRMSEGDFTMAGLSWVGDYNDAMTFLDLYLSDSPQNRARFANEEYDEYIREAMSNQDQKVRIDAMVEAEHILMNEMPIAPTQEGTFLYVERPYVKNMVRLPILVESGKKWAYVLEH
ncbi:peptide ABC transporter substrate-binding protein [Sporosalibacterium faouarense]|uniref:peptide ABC transporter substrate-binding protein n=1 Tax=Sporosalibacterium faouarense TaxID=516123 RepID=UPI00192A8909|nr:peptide ABC transporter substrate-binding protein [Sporosalibacterium faouarense]